MSGSLSKLFGGRGLVLTHGDGPYVWDAQGRCYVDFFNGHGAALFGHAHPALLEAVKEAEAGVWSCGAGYDSPVREEVANLLAEGMGRDATVFLCNSGTEAIEGALKLAAALRKGRDEIIAARRGFHGRSCGSLGLTFNPKYRAPFASFIHAAKHYAPEEIPEKITDATLAVFIEPVQGEGGVYPIPEEVGRAITEACRAHGTLLVADEVQTGLGRCGSFFGPRTLRKLLRVVPPRPRARHNLRREGARGRTARRSSRLAQRARRLPAAHARFHLRRQRIRRARIGGGAKARQERKPLRPRRRARRLHPLRNREQKHPALIGVESEMPSQDIVKALQDNRLLSLPAGPRVVRFLPSFAVTREAAAEGVEIFERTMRELAAKGGKA